ncbi:hypothetical protein ACHAPU_007857 [Fusarium lateritium]
MIQAHIRDCQHPRMGDQDMRYAFVYFEIEPRMKRNQEQVPSGVTTATTEINVPSSVPVASIVPAAPLALMEDSDEGSLFMSRSSSTVESVGKWEDSRRPSIASMTSVSSDEDAAEPWKHPRLSAERSQTIEYTRVVASEEPDNMDIDSVVLGNDATSEMANPNWDFPSQLGPAEYQPQSPSDLVNGIEYLESKVNQDKEELVKNITDLKASVQTKLADMVVNHTPAPNEALATLYQTLDTHNQEKEKIQRGGVFFKQHSQEDMYMDEETAAETHKHYYTTKLRECEVAIKTTQAQIDQELEKSAQRKTDTKAQIDKDLQQVQQWEHRERDIKRNLEYYSAVKGLMNLGPHGMETLLTKLKYDNIPILEMVDEVKTVCPRGEGTSCMVTDLSHAET